MSFRLGIGVAILSRKLHFEHCKVQNRQYCPLFIKSIDIFCNLCYNS